MSGDSNDVGRDLPQSKSIPPPSPPVEPAGPVPVVPLPSPEAAAKPDPPLPVALILRVPPLRWAVAALAKHLPDDGG